jgi:hypothetical protein
MGISAAALLHARSVPSDPLRPAGAAARGGAAAGGGLSAPDLDFVSKAPQILSTIMHQDLHQNESSLAFKH